MPTHAEIHDSLTRIFRDIFKDPGIVLKADSTPDTIAGWDSFKYVSILMAIENVYGIEMDGPELDHVQNVGELVTLIHDKSG
jgi:acyl carrier protein